MKELLNTEKAKPWFSLFSGFDIELFKAGKHYNKLGSNQVEHLCGSGILNGTALETAPILLHGRPHSLSLTLPPLGLSVLKFSHPFDWFVA